MNLTIRQAGEADLPAVLALSDALTAEGCRNGMVPDTLEYLRDWKRLMHLYIDELGFEFWMATLYRDL